MTNIDIENAELIMPFRNFSGKPTKFNPQGGKREFAVYIPEDVAEQLEEDGWTIKMSRPRNEDENPRPYIRVAVNFSFRPPEIMVGTRKDQMVKMTEDTVGELDWADITSCDLSIRPRPYDVNGKQGIKAYLAEMYVIISRSAFADKYACTEDDSVF